MDDVSMYHVRRLQRRATTLLLKASELRSDIGERMGAGPLFDLAGDVMRAAHDLDARFEQLAGSSND